MALNLAAQNLAELLHARVRIHPDKTAYIRKRNSLWVSHTWADLGRDVFLIAMALKDAGVKAGDAVAILSQTRPEWSLADFAILSLGAVSIPIYSSVKSDEVDYILKNSGAKFLFVEDGIQRDKVRALLEQSPSSLQFISFDSVTDGPFLGYDTWLTSIQAKMRDAGSEASDLEQWKTSAGAIRPETLATIVYTSGTTGLPKGAEVTHGAFLCICADSKDALGLEDTDTTLLFLPTAHILGRAEHMFLLGIGWTIAFAENLGTIMDNMNEVKPTILVSVPRIYEKLYAAIHSKFSNKGYKKAIFDRALAVGRAYSQALQRGLQPSLVTRAQYEFFDRIIFQKVRERFGGRLRFTISGGAPLAAEIAEFFHACGILILEGYGLTETTGPIACNRPKSFKFGTVGHLLPSAQLKVAQDGEILLKGGMLFQGYHDRPDLTNEVMVGDYFATGDIGVVDPDGFLKITDRKKDLIITAGGKNIAPQKIENLLKSDILFSNVVVFGDRQKYLVALLTINVGEARRLASANGVGFRDIEDLVSQPEFNKLVKKRLDASNRNLPSYEQIKRFRILPRELSIEAGELTPSLKVKRKFCEQKYSEIITQLFT